MNRDYTVEVRNLSVSYNGKKALENISFGVLPQQRLIGVIGPNGGGKSTLMKAMMGLIWYAKGEIRIWRQPVTRVCKKIAYVPQHKNVDLDFPVLVEDVVMMGRYPYLTWWGRPTTQDRELVALSLQQVGMWGLRKQQIGQLSGGQQQRVFLARALAQEADLLFLDEPFTGIDIASENIIINLLNELKEQGKTIFVVHHDLSKAESYFDSLLLLNRKLIAFGDTTDVFQVPKLRKAYSGSVAVLSSRNELVVVHG